MTSENNPVPSRPPEEAVPRISRGPRRAWRRFKKICRWTGLVLVAWLALALVISAIWNLRATTRLERTIAAIRASGQPLTADELNKMYRASFTGDNSAKYYLAAFALNQEEDLQLTMDVPIVGATTNRPALGEKMADKTRHASEVYLASQQDFLQMLEKANSMGDCWFHSDFAQRSKMHLPGVASVRAAARTQAVQSLASLDRDDVPSAIRAAKATVLLAGSLKHEPALISQFVRIAVLGIAADQVERILSASPLANEELETLEQVLSEGTIAPDTFSKCMISSRSLTFLSRTREIESHTFLLCIINEDADMDSIVGHWPEYHPAYWLERLFLSGWAKDELNACLKRMDEPIQAGNLPPRQARTRLAELETREARERGGPLQLIPHHWVLSGQLLSASSAAWEKFLRCQMYMDLVRTALAIERFRNDNQRLPDSLDELVPKYRQEIPEDHFAASGKIRYKKNEKGYVVYSVGPDGVDNEGTDLEPHSREHPGWDIVFRVAR